MQLKVLAHRALSLFALFSANLSVFSVNIQLVAAGQTFTNGLTIIDSPSPNKYVPCTESNRPLIDSSR